MLPRNRIAISIRELSLKSTRETWDVLVTFSSKKQSAIELLIDTFVLKVLTGKLQTYENEMGELAPIDRRMSAPSVVKLERRSLRSYYEITMIGYLPSQVNKVKVKISFDNESFL